MTPAIVHRFSIPIREAMSALLADDQVEAESYEIRVIGNCLVIDLVAPAVPFAEQADPPQTREMLEREEMKEGIADGDVVEENGDEPPPPVRYFYHPEHDFLLQSTDGNEPARVANEDGWIEIDAKEGEEILAEHAKQGGLFGAEPAAEQEDQDQNEDEAKPEPEARKGGKLAQRAGIICAEGAFWKFMQEANEEDATAALRNTCGISSRADLDHNPEAAHEFKKLEAEYRAWLND